MAAGAHLAAGWMLAGPERRPGRAESGRSAPPRRWSTRGKTLDKADKAHESGDWPAIISGALQETRESVELAFTSLKQTGKNSPAQSEAF